MSNYPANNYYDAQEGYVNPSAPQQPAYNPNIIIQPIGPSRNNMYPRQSHGRHRRFTRVVYVDELDYIRQQERMRRDREKKGLWQCLAASLCCLFCCFPFPR